jgi:hypothetical protein
MTTSTLESEPIAFRRVNTARRTRDVRRHSLVGRFFKPAGRFEKPAHNASTLFTRVPGTLR